jgi:hypothetical protein
MPEYTQIARQEFPSTDPNRQGKVDVGYVYMDERMRTHMITLPLEEDSADRVAALLKERVEAAEAGGARRIEL